MNEKFECNVNNNIERCPEHVEPSLEEKLSYTKHELNAMRFDIRKLNRAKDSMVSQNHALVSALAELHYVNKEINNNLLYTDYSLDLCRSRLADIRYECQKQLKETPNDSNFIKFIEKIMKLVEY